MGNDPEDKPQEGLRIGIGFTEEGNPVECDGCGKSVVAVPEENKEQFYRTTFTHSHKCPECGARGIIVTYNGVPTLIHPRMI